VSHELTRRELLRVGVACGAALGAYGMASGTIARALADSPKCGRLEDIEHVVILVQENRSFDHYFGTYRGVRGFTRARWRSPTVAA
jgi:phospholipase C